MMEANNDRVIDVWYGNIEPSGQHSLQRYEKLLDASERARIKQFSNDHLRKQYLGVRGRLRLVLAEYTGTKPEDIRFAQEVYGKPFLPDHPEIAFNISHSGNKLAVAVAHQCLLGIDIEFWKRRVNFPAMVKKCFADVECHYWHALPDETKIAVFYDFWTKKESFVKAVGRGIALGMDQCVISPEQPDQFYSLPEPYGPALDWKIIKLQLGEGISGAVSVRNGYKEISMNYFR